jgi:hypothetical protein
MDKTEAVNDCLTSRGLRTVTRYDDPSLFAATAWRTVVKAHTKMEVKGWWYNTEYNWKLSPDSNGEIEVPNNVIAMRTYGDSRPYDLSIVSGKIYNMETHSTILTDIVDSNGQITFVFIMSRDFDDLPDSAKHYYAARAVRIYLQEQDGDMNKIRSAAEDEKEARKIFGVEHRRHKKMNKFRNTKSVYNVAKMGGNNVYAGAYVYPNFRFQG